jgi:hypothetical protein
VWKRRLPVQNVAPGPLENLLCPAPPLDTDHRVVDTVSESDRWQRPLEVDREALDGRDEAGEGDDCRRPRPVRTEAERVAHHRALRETAERGSPRSDAGLLGERVEPAACGGIAGEEGVGIGIPELTHDVPVRPAGRQPQRRARRQPEQPSLGIERVEKREEVALIGPAAVEEDQCSRWIAVRWPDAVDECGETAAQREVM